MLQIKGTFKNATQEKIILKYIFRLVHYWGDTSTAIFVVRKKAVIILIVAFRKTYYKYMKRLHIV